MLRNKGTNSRQFGGRKGIGTTEVLADYLQSIIEATRNGSSAAGIFFDYSAAFNTGNRRDMIDGFAKMGIGGQELHMLSQLMTNRSIMTRIGSATSKKEPTDGGAGQGTLAGLYMYLSGANEYNKLFPKDKVDYINDWSYVDDCFALCKLLLEMSILWDDDGDVKRLYVSETLQKVADAMANFARQRKYKLNATKTKIMIYGNHQVEPTVNIQCNGTVVDLVDSFKVLGITLDPKLSMNAHIKEIERKVAKRIYILRTLKKNGADVDALIMVYKAQIRSIIEYGSPAFMPLLTEGQIHRLERMQNLCIKTCTSFEMRSSEIRERYQIQTIRERMLKLTDNMIRKENSSGRMGWFRSRENSEYIAKLRQPREVQENQERSQKGFQGPIAYYRRRLNFLLNEEVAK